MQQPREEHWLAALKTIRYLKGTVGQGVLFRAEPTFSVTVWCDADWGACPTTRRSLSGWIIQFGTSPINSPLPKPSPCDESNYTGIYLD